MQQLCSKQKVRSVGSRVRGAAGGREAKRGNLASVVVE